MILSNQAECLDCGDKPYSAHRHDYNECSCGNVSVDGGMDYIRHSYRNSETYRNISIVWSDDLVKESCLELKRMLNTNRNALGLTCALARVLRDNGYEIREIDKCDSET